MATNRQITANRRNARKSTGPRSSVGKSASRRNALAHGLGAAEILVPDEDESAYKQFQQQLLDQLMPANTLESELVERIVGYLWRLRRCRRIEANLLGGGSQIMERILHAAPQSYINDLAKDDNMSNDTLIDLYFETSKKERQSNPLTYDIQVGFNESASEGDIFGKLARYEAGLDRAFYRALHELQRLQAIRMNQPASAPPTLDLNISIEES